MAYFEATVHALWLQNFALQEFFAVETKIIVSIYFKSCLYKLWRQYIVVSIFVTSSSVSINYRDEMFSVVTFVINFMETILLVLETIFVFVSNGKLYIFILLDH